MSNFQRSKCWAPLRLFKIGVGGYIVNTGCVALHRHKGPHIWRLQLEGSRFIEVTSDQVKEIL